MPKPTRKQKLLGRKTREFSERETIQNTKIISKVFMDFSKDFENQNKALFAEKEISISYRMFRNAIKKALVQIFTKSSGNSANFVNGLYGWKLKDDLIKNISSKVVQDYNKKYVASRVTNITKTTEKRLNKIIADGQKKGLNNRDIAKQIQENIEGMSKARARTIARTETFNSIQNTSNATAQEAGIEKKTWLHTHGGKTARANHQALDGVEKEMDEYFEFGEEKGLYPHDPNLSADNTVNCYCVAIYA